MIKPFSSCARVVLAISIALMATSVLKAQGIALDGAGPINRAMGGAATAAPIDSIGALLWNPATISGLPCSEIAFGMELLLPSETLSSSIQAGALGGGLPAATLSGWTNGEPGAFPIPSMAWVNQVEGTPWAYGIGIFGVAGFSVNYPASTSNPVLLPQSNVPGVPGGLGHVYADAQFIQIVPTVSYSLSDRLSIGFGPSIMMARLMVDPMSFAAPDDGDGSLAATYPTGCSTRYAWGGGFQIGMYYVANQNWQYGFTFKSPQWMEPLRYDAVSESGAPRQIKVHIDYPMILSFGTAYRGFDRWLLACDVRYFDYRSASGFGDAAGYNALGAVTGLGWDSVVSVHLGAQYQMTERFCLRFGYQYNDNPIGGDVAFFNVASPLIIQHIVSTGFSYNVADNVILSAAYMHGFENDVSGPFNLPGVGPVAGTSVTSQVAADAVAIGVTVRY